MPGLLQGAVAALPKPLVLGLAGAVVVGGGAIVATQVTGGGSKDDDARLAQASKVLQSVNVSLGPSGDLTDVSGTLVGTTTDGKQFSVDKDYTPGKVAHELPVRVLTSYRTAKGSGTDLSDLKGYDGRVDISLTVQNLTQRAEELSYDVGGAQQTRSALVGVPLTVVASTSLPDTKPSSVISQGSAGDEGTNGVLSQDDKGSAQVQWATILAPPQLDSSTTMRLSLDAKDFDVPDFDLSVEPGLVTDPSVGSVINAAFSPAGSSELALQRRTISLIGKVNAVLGKAGSTLGRVRSTLDDSSANLGTKTVGDLRQSTQTITSSVQGLQESSQSLGKDLTSSLKGTQSTTLAELQQMTEAVDQLLGDTGASAPTARVTGGTCSATVARPTGATSIYGNLLEVVSLLKGYSQATNGCKQVVQQQLLGVVGPAIPAGDGPAAAMCGDQQYADSLTCTLYRSSTALTGLATDLQTQADAAAQKLSGLQTADLIHTVNGVLTDTNGDGKVDDQDEYTGGLVQAVSAVVKSVQALGSYDVIKNGNIDTTDVKNALDRADTALGTVSSTASALSQKARSGATDAQKILDKNTDLADTICTLAAGNQVSTAAALELRRYTSTTSCEKDADGNPVAFPDDQSMATALQKQVTDQNALADQLDPAGTAAGGMGAALATVKAALEDTQDDSVVSVREAVNQLDDANDVSNDPNELHTVQQAYTALKQAVASIDNNPASPGNCQDDLVCEVVQYATQVNNQKGATGDSVSNVLEKAVAGVQQNAAAQRGANVDAVRKAAQQSSDEVSDLFEKSLGGLSSSADEIASDGKKTIAAQKSTFAVRQNASAGQVSKSIDQGLTRVQAGVSGSTKDLAAARALLGKDLADVLADLGTRNVRGSGLLGAISRSAASTGTANYQLALASTTASSYATVRRGDIATLLLRQAQADAAQQAEADLPAFAVTLPQSAQHTTVYSFHVKSGA